MREANLTNKRRIPPQNESGSSVLAGSRIQAVPRVRQSDSGGAGGDVAGACGILYSWDSRRHRRHSRVS